MGRNGETPGSFASAGDWWPRAPISSIRLRIVPDSSAGSRPDRDTRPTDGRYHRGGAVTGDYEIRQATPADFPDLARVRSAAFGGPVGRTDAYLRWKYLENPYTATPFAWVALHDGHLIGFRAMTAMPWVIPGVSGPIIFGQAGDSSILERHRGRGVYGRLNEAALTGLAGLGIHHAISMSASTRNFVIHRDRFGWYELLRYRMLRLAAAPAGRMRRVATVAHRALRRLPLQRPDQAGLLRRIDAAADDLAKRDIEVEATPRTATTGDSGDPQRIRPVRDAAHWAWRRQSPVTAYRFLTSEKASLAVGVNRGGLRGNLVDWDGDPDGLAHLVQSLVESTGPERLDMWADGLPNDLLRQLGRVGFVELPSNRPSGMLIQRTGAGAQSWMVGSMDLRDPDKWDLRMIASDRY